jgi:S-adenosylmethionine:tRNA ribosyltransferase-isomerase
MIASRDPRSRAVDDTAPLLVAERGPRARRDDVRMVVVDRARGASEVRRFDELPGLLAAGDLVVVNDAATWPASLSARTAFGSPIELRLTTGAVEPGGAVTAVVFGAGDWRIRTEHRPPPPPLRAGDVLRVDGGPALRVIAAPAPRLVTLALPDDDAGVRALHRAGRPVQYAHLDAPLAPWDVQTVYAGRPWAVEMPSAGRPLTWSTLLALATRGVTVAPLTHAAGLSSTGDAALDATLPWPERFEIPPATAALVSAARTAGRRVVAVGTTVVRALETGRPSGITDLVLSATHHPTVVDAVLSGLHDPSESHFRLLEAFAPRELLLDAWNLACRHQLRSHELGDSLLLI